MNKGKELVFGIECIEIINHKKESGLSKQKWNCDECSLFFLSKDKLQDHKKKHSAEYLREAIKCQYCNKTLSIKDTNKECYTYRKCNTCEYKCAKCPLSFKRHSDVVIHQKSHFRLKRKQSMLINKRLSKEHETESLRKVSKKHISDKMVPELRNRKRALGVLQNDEFGYHDTSDTVQTNNNIKDEFINSNTKSKDKICVDKIKNTISDLSNDSVNTSSHENMVNYKPFSCHICGENFASHNSLLVHIQSHGENISKGFKCKHCNEEFEDIYKMQYHLAVCPLVEDDTTLVAPKFPISPPIRPVIKRGRPRKIKLENQGTNMEYDRISPLSTRGSTRKRKQSNVNSECVTDLSNILGSSSPKYSTRSRRNIAYNPEENVSVKKENLDSSSDVPDYDNGVEDYPSDDCLDNTDVHDLNNDSSDIIEEDKSKIHSCPFPRCGIKFSREKALLCHMRNHNDDFEDSYKCHKCDIPLDNIHSLRSHLNECNEIKDKNDDISEPEYTEDYNSSEKSLKKKKEFTCNICSQSFTSEEKMIRHLAIHGSSNFICRICKNLFINQSLLDEHFIEKHPQKSSYHCEICNEDFISELFLNIHESEYHADVISTNTSRDDSFNENDSSTNRSRCYSYCSIVATKSTSGNRSQFWCPVCFNSFNMREDMRSHLFTEHILLTDSVYICEVCKAEKPTAQMLCYHLEMHSGNLLSVNRFSSLRACVYGKEIKCNDVNPNTINSEIWHQNSAFVNEGETIKFGKSVAATENIKQKNINTTKSKSKGKLLKMKKERRCTSVNPLHENDKIPKKILTKGNDLSSNYLETVTKKTEINKAKRLIKRKTVKPHKNLRKYMKIIDSNPQSKNVVFLSRVTNILSAKGNDSTFESSKQYIKTPSDEDSLDGSNISTVGHASELETQAKVSPIGTGNDEYNEMSSCTQQSSEVSGYKQADDDSCNEEMRCSMCSRVFCQQEELLDHIATHI